MKTKVFTNDTLKEAADLLKEGEVVAFPTETVYGLGAIASSQKAVERVYQVKGRPSDNPLIVHVASKNIQAYVESVSTEAHVLMDAFWPGPCTIILTAKEGVFAPAISAGRETVSLRMPDQEATLRLIEQVGFPIVGPSANTSGKPSPTSARHVLHDLDGEIAGVLDGGNTQIGIESTVIDLTDPNGPIILRPGAITKEMMEAVLHKPVRMGGTMEEGEEAPKAPGMKYIHYSPKQPVIAVRATTSEWMELIKREVEAGKRIGVIASIERLEELQNDLISHTVSLGNFAHTEEAAQQLYAALRTMDESDVSIILAEAYPFEGIGIAFMNRLEKAASTLYYSTTDSTE